MQDVSDDMDLLAAMLAISDMPSHPAEARWLVWYGKTALQNPLLETPFNERRRSSLEPNDPKYEVKVLRKNYDSQVLQPFDRSKGQVVALVLGQALSCGIGPDLPTRATYLSAKDVLRWSKLSEWLDKFDQRNPTDQVAISQPEEPDYPDLLYEKIRGAGLRLDSLSVHVSDLPGDSSLALDSDIWVDMIEFVYETKILLILLVALPLIYGGIHLTTWNFHFASQTEHLLWKIACIDIMGTIPLSVACVGCMLLIKRLSRAAKVSWVIFTPLFVFYALSRIYILVESFISLRHVPIGVYAAIPWVQDIPHI